MHDEDKELGDAIDAAIHSQVRECGGIKSKSFRQTKREENLGTYVGWPIFWFGAESKSAKQV